MSQSVNYYASHFGTDIDLKISVPDETEFKKFFLEVSDDFFGKPATFDNLVAFQAQVEKYVRENVVIESQCGRNY